MHATNHANRPATLEFAKPPKPAAVERTIANTIQQTMANLSLFRFLLLSFSISFFSFPLFLYVFVSYCLSLFLSLLLSFYLFLSPFSIRPPHLVD
jgi:hypothetical protein